MTFRGGFNPDFVKSKQIFNNLREVEGKFKVSYNGRKVPENDIFY